MFPQIPSWDAMHPMIVHFPIALLLIVPLLLVMGLVWKTNGRGLMIAALVLMAAGTIGTYVAFSTGSAGEDVAEKIIGAKTVLEQHEELAETTRIIFTVLTLIFAAILLVPRLLKKELGQRTAAFVTSAFLLFYLAGTVVLANTAHQGGRLVHELGVRAAIGSSAQQIGPQGTSTNGKTDKDDD